MFVWEDGEQVSPAKIKEDGSIQPAVYKGKTPFTAFMMNKMQDEIIEEIKRNKGIIELTGTDEELINANEIVEVGVYKVTGNKINFYNNETETLILEVTLNNTSLVQSITTSNGIALRVGQYADEVLSFGEWDVLTGEKQVGYADEELEGTEKILIEDADFDGVIADEIVISETITNENGTAIKYNDGTMICYMKKSVTGVLDTQWGPFYYFLTENFQFPEEFISNPIVSYNVSGANTAIILNWEISQNLIAYTDKYAICRPFQNTSEANFTVDITAIGKWK